MIRRKHKAFKTTKLALYATQQNPPKPSDTDQYLRSDLMSVHVSPSHGADEIPEICKGIQVIHHILRVGVARPEETVTIVLSSSKA